MVAILILLAKLGPPGFLKKKVFWNKGYEVIIFAYAVVNNILSRNSNYIVDLVVMWLKFSKNFYERSYHNFNFIKIWPEKTIFFEGCSLFKFNNFGLIIPMALKFYASGVAKRSKLKGRKILRLIPTFVELTVEKLVGESFNSPHPE